MQPNNDIIDTKTVNEMLMSMKFNAIWGSHCVVIISTMTDIRARFQELFDREVRIDVTTDRTFIGRLWCVDYLGNVMLRDCTEIREVEGMYLGK